MGACYKFRRAVDEDKADIQHIWKKEETETLFCVEDVGRLIELCTLSIVMTDDDDEVAGFLALDDHPPIPAVNPSGWELWVRNMFGKHFLSFDTLFIHFICCTESVLEIFLQKAFTSVFMNDMYLQHIILVVPPTCKIDCPEKYPIFKRRSIRKKCTIYEGIENCIYLLVSMRIDLCPKLRVRRAVEEDNDDVVEILDKNSKNLKELYGEYYISEMVSRHPDSRRRILVAEEKQRGEDRQKVVGVMCLNPAINYEKLQHTYSLEPYHGLMKISHPERDKIKSENALLETFGKPIMLGKWSPFADIDNKNPKRVPSKTKKVKKSKSNLFKSSKVNFRSKHPDHTSRPSDEPDRLSEHSVSLHHMDASVMYIMDDEPLDYEIVNIDSTLFAAPSTSDVSSTRKLFQSDSSRIRKKTSSAVKYKEGPLFEGEPNAFMVELFRLRDDIDDRRAFDLLEAAFAYMPDYEYCILRIPSSNKAFRLLQHFTVVPSKNRMCSSYALYVAHQNSVLGKLRVRKAEIADVPQIAMLVRNVEGKSTISTVEQAIHNRQKYFAYVFLSGHFLVGVALLEAATHENLIRTKFIVEAHQNLRYHDKGLGFNADVAMIQTALAYPAFEPHFGFFAREMMRNSGCNSIMWLTTYRNKWMANKTNGIVTAMTPLTFRKSLVSGFSKVKSSSKNLHSFSAWFLSKKLTSVKRLNVDTRIVVVGASRTAMSFLFHLLFGVTSTYLTFTNVTLVSTNGLPYLRNSNPVIEHMFPKFRSTCERFLKSMPFTYYVSVVKGTMVEIDKQSKCIITGSSGKYFYDLLFLMIGKQYQYPDYRNIFPEKDKVRSGQKPEYVKMDDPRYEATTIEPSIEHNAPANVFLINNVHDAHRALSYVKTLPWRFTDYTIIVYGSNIDAYCCLTGLIESGVPIKNITFVESFPPSDVRKIRVPFFCNTRVDEMVKNYFESLNVVTYRGYHFKNWNTDDCNFIESVEFLSHYYHLNLKCVALFFFDKRFIDPYAFIAINKCGLAYDGGILVDHLCLTKDPAIYAAGSVTRFYRRYNAEDKLSKFYDSFEIGKALAEQISKQLDPLLPASDRNTWFQSKQESDSSTFGSCRCSSSDSSCTCQRSAANVYKRLLPNLEKPLVWYCKLPGDVQYLEVRPPGAKFPHYYVMTKNYNGNVIETEKSGYFKLHINRNQIVDGITCLSAPGYTSIEDFKLLYGHSVAVLNNVEKRYKAGLIDNLYKFFRQPWTTFIYSERSKELLNMLGHIKPQDEPNGLSLKEMVEIIIKIDANSDDEISEETLQKRHVDFEKNFEAITNYVIEWLSGNDLKHHLFATPGNINTYSHSACRHPAFTRRKKSFEKMLSSAI